MERHTFLTVLGFSLLAVVVALLIPGQPREQAVDLPWQITPTDDGSIEVFGLTLGKTPLAVLERKLGEEAEVSLFVSPEGEYRIEGYFDQVILSGLRAKMVVVSGLDAAGRERAFSQGLRIANLGGDRRKVTLHPDDLAAVRQAPVAIITYLPKSGLDEELITRRFGEPARRVKETETEVVHWLYPDKGLDLALDANGKAVLQYIAPREFERLSAPLEAAADS